VAKLKSGEITTSELLDVLEARISDIDSNINALPTLCLGRAKEFANKNDNKNKILAGLPIAIKDLSDVAGVKTTFGSAIYKDNISASSDIMVEHLENAGGVVYAKSNTPEFGTGGNTVNQIFGITRNPWDTRMSTAGSSGGAAAALATGMAWLAQGSDMGGSLRNPASFCNIVGLRPSVGRVARTPGIHVMDTLSVNGPMARNVKDVALMLDAMSGHEIEDPLSMHSSRAIFLDAANSPQLPETVTYSFDLGITPIDSQVRKTFSDALKKIEASGVKLIETHPDFSNLQEIFYVLRAHSYASNFAVLIKNHKEKLNPNVLWNIEEGLKLSIDDVRFAEIQRVNLVSQVQNFFRNYPIILTPTTIVPPYPVTQNHISECNGHQFENYYLWLSIAYAFTVGLCPAISIPMGFTKNELPVGLQIAAKNYDEGTIISAAAKIEEILNIDQTPINPKITPIK